MQLPNYILFFLQQWAHWINRPEFISRKLHYHPSPGWTMLEDTASHAFGTLCYVQVCWFCSKYFLQDQMLLWMQDSQNTQAETNDEAMMTNEEIIKEPRGTSKELQASLHHKKLNVCQKTWLIPGILGNYSVDLWDNGWNKWTVSKSTWCKTNTGTWTLVTKFLTSIMIIVFKSAVKVLHYCCRVTHIISQCFWYTLSCWLADILT